MGVIMYTYMDCLYSCNLYLPYGSRKIKVSKKNNHKGIYCSQVLVMGYHLSGITLAQ